jgi:hypothetical protein
MKQECPYLELCKMPKESYRCYDDMFYTRCIVYQRLESLGYKLKIKEEKLEAFYMKDDKRNKEK